MRIFEFGVPVYSWVVLENLFTVQKSILEYTMNSVSGAINWFTSLFTNNLLGYETIYTVWTGDGGVGNIDKEESEI